MTGLLDSVLQLGLGARPPAVSAAARNVILYPATAPPTVRTAVLTHAEGGLGSDATLPVRVSVLLGPGATFQGVADVLLSRYTMAGSPPTRDQLARAIVVYNQAYLPTGAWTAHRVGLRLPLPIEIEQPGGGWLVDPDAVRAQAAQFEGAWLARLTTAPDMLPLPEPVTALPTQAQQLVTDHPGVAALGAALRDMVLRNPFEAVLPVLAVLATSAAPADLGLAALDGTAAHQMAMLASTSAGQGVLRVLHRVLDAAPAGTDAVRLAAARGLLDGALRLPDGTRTPMRELPETARQLAHRGPIPPGVGAAEAAGGRHRIVLGRDFAVGRVATETITGIDYRGPAYAGWLPPAPFAVADTAHLPADATTVARLAVVTGIAANEGALDAVRMRDRALLSCGIHQWSAFAGDELPALLSRFKGLAPQEFEVYIGMYGLDVAPDPAHASQFLLQQVDASDTATTLDYLALRTFLGGTDDQGTITFDTTWAARFRAAAVCSEAYRRCQILEAVARFDRLRRDVGTLTVHGAPMAVDDLITSQLGVALLLDAHINKPARVGPVLRAIVRRRGLPDDPDQLDQAVTRRFRAARDVYDRDTRNAGVDAGHFAVGHGSFTGW